jgi:hypothetical protein
LNAISGKSCHAISPQKQWPIGSPAPRHCLVLRIHAQSAAVPRYCDRWYCHAIMFNCTNENSGEWPEHHESQRLLACLLITSAAKNALRLPHAVAAK